MAAKTAIPPASAYSYPLLLKHLLHTPLAHAPDQQIIYRDRVRYSYRDFRRRVGRLANVLTALGVAPGDRVAVMDWDSHRYLECYFAVPMLGGVLMMVNVRLSHEQIAYTVDHCGAETLLVHNDFALVLEAIRSDIPKVRRIVVMNDDEVAPTDDAAGEYEALLAEASPEFDFPDFDEDTRATTFYTTGTTGLPKGVYFSHRQLVLHTLAGMAALASAPLHQRFHRGDVYMPLTPMFHVHAWGLPYIATLMGVKQVYPGRYVPDQLIALARREGVTFSHGVPTLLRMILGAAGKTARFDGWKMVVGGAALPHGLCAEALARGIDVFAGYGMSETCPLLTLAQARTDCRAIDGSVDPASRTNAGLPLPLVELRAVDSEMRDLCRDGESVGEIVVRAPWLTQGYLDNRDASEDLWRDGYLHTQDLGRIEVDGTLRIVDRLKDVIKSGGEWVSSLDVEHLITQHPSVAEAAVIGVPDEKWGERPLAVVVAKREFADTLTTEELRSHLLGFAGTGALSRFAVPDRICIVPFIERTSVGKLDKKALRRKYSSAERA